MKLRVLIIFICTCPFGCYSQEIDSTELNNFQVDSISSVGKYPPLNTYFFAWSKGKCGVISKTDVLLPLVYNARDLKFGDDGLIEIKTPNKPYTIFDPKDSIYYKLSLNNNDSIWTTYQVVNMINGTSFIIVTQQYEKGEKAIEFFSGLDLHFPDRVFIIDRINDSLVNSFDHPNSKYLALGDIVLEIEPINKKKLKYLVTIHAKYSTKELVNYVWYANEENEIISFKGLSDPLAETRIIRELGYYTVKDKYVKIGYLDYEDMVFHKKLKKLKLMLTRK